MVEVGTAVLLLRIGMVPAVDDVEAAMEAETAPRCASAGPLRASAAVAAAACLLVRSNYRVEGKKSVHVSHAFCVVTTYHST